MLLVVTASVTILAACGGSEGAARPNATSAPDVTATAAIGAGTPVALAEVFATVFLPAEGEEPVPCDGCAIVFVGTERTVRTAAGAAGDVRISLPAGTYDIAYPCGGSDEASLIPVPFPSRVTLAAGVNTLDDRHGDLLIGAAPGSRGRPRAR